MQTMLLLTLAVVPYAGNAARGSDDDSVAALRKFGASIVFDEAQPGKPVIGIDFGSARGKITDQSMEHVAGFSHLQELQLKGTSITDAALIHLQRLTNLRNLDLEDTRISNAGLKHLSLNAPFAKGPTRTHR